MYETKAAENQIACAQKIQRSAFSIRMQIVATREKQKKQEHCANVKSNSTQLGTATLYCLNFHWIALKLSINCRSKTVSSFFL